ncbi:MAG: ComEC family competence protein [Flaviaesturariibacter sp.]|nr:ComEC family competence protein [Flaviaesturariibacter sp.]
MLRLLIPFILGIGLQWYVTIPLLWLCAAGFVACGISSFLLFFSTARKFQIGWLQGTALQILLVVLGSLAVWSHDIRNTKNWFGHQYAQGEKLLVTLQEPLVEKAASYKALGEVKGLYKEGVFYKAAGKLLVYFKKDASALQLGYGSQVVIGRPLQEIRNSGNPGGFDYKRYSLFAGITHQVYLTPADYKLLPQQNEQAFRRAIFHSRKAIVRIFKENIAGAKEQGLAEALLIGYKDDLDKKLVQSYTNTGVVHIIAISGLHLALIYSLLMWVTKLMKGRQLQWWRLLIVVSCLWVFSLLTGAQPSVLRAAVMFTAIASATVLKRRTSIYNTIALAAFLLLCWNPFWLWDVGFQLSFLAVLSIIIFYQPIYNWVFIENKTVDYLWKLLAGSLAAQVLTLPICIYYFHQFPVLFLFANLLAVPLSGLIVYAEIILCVFHFIKPLATFWGWVLTKSIRLMNTYIERLETVPFAVWNGMSITVWQTVLLYGFIIGIAHWLMRSVKRSATLAFVCLAALTCLRSYSFVQANKQHKLIVYNIPKHQAIDIMDGRRYAFLGDAALTQNDFLRNFHLQPSRVQDRVMEDSLAPTKGFGFYGKQVLVVDTTCRFSPLPIKPPIDLLVLSKNPKLYISDLTNTFAIKQVVIDGSVPQWKAARWQRDCDSLRIPCYNVVENGAFVLNW